MTDLIARLEAAEAGSRELDGEVWYAVHEPDVEHGALHIEQTDQGPIEVLTCELGSKYADCVENYTTSLDAALALAERMLPGDRTIGLQQNRCTDPEIQKRCRWTCFIEWTEDGENFEISPAASTPALALCAAILRAKGSDQ